MTEPASPTDLPRAAIRRRRSGFPLVWAVPLSAALVAGYLFGTHVNDMGPTITIAFDEVNGLRNGHTWVQYRGVHVGDVEGIELSKDLQKSLVRVRLQRSMASIARDGSIFWIVRPELGLSSISGLGAVVAGPHIEVLPGTGGPRREFVGLVSSPAVLDTAGLHVMLRAGRAGMLRANMPVYYRGIEVGAIQECRLSTNATLAEIHVFIRQRYAPLVCEGTKFWKASGADMSFGLFGGLDINVESLRSLLAGGVSFATPEGETNRAAPGASFTLHDDATEEWLKWEPHILIE